MFTSTGNVYQRNKAITAFQWSVNNDSATNSAAGVQLPRVLMLSLVRLHSAVALGRCSDMLNYRRMQLQERT